MGELEKLGYVKQSMKTPFADYIEWNNPERNVRISYNERSIYIREMKNKRPTPLTVKEVMSILVDLGFADIVKDSEE